MKGITVATSSDNGVPREGSESRASRACLSSAVSFRLLSSSSLDSASCIGSPWFFLLIRCNSLSRAAELILELEELESSSAMIRMPNFLGEERKSEYWSDRVLYYGLVISDGIRQKVSLLNLKRKSDRIQDMLAYVNFIVLYITYSGVEKRSKLSDDLHARYR